jgi:hypothetical protein
MIWTLAALVLLHIAALMWPYHGSTVMPDTYDASVITVVAGSITIAIHLLSP